MTWPRRAVLGLLALAACGGRDAGGARGDSAGAASPRPSAVLLSPDGMYEIHLPERWNGHYVVDSLSTAERGRARPGALVFLYQPSDSTLRLEALLVIATYDSAAWQAVRAEGGPPPGDSVAARAGRVFVLALPQSNPFTPNTPDAILFDLLKLRPKELPGVVQPK
ncbi:MAG TPA: hypothetical protein VL241_12165 [Gemmatimonadales bacterium]|nr:hypothetical protein [Gemmatimonadales bacterium]